MFAEEFAVDCPFCGETITILVDASAGSQEYVEDCQVCCQPMEVVVGESASGELMVEVRRE